MTALRGGDRNIHLHQLYSVLDFLTGFVAEAACDGRLTALMLVTVCMATDLSASKIYNFLTVPAAAAGLCIQILSGNVSGILTASAAAGLTMAALLPFYQIHGLGAGDCKLLSALCFLLSWQQYITCLFASFILGAVIAFLVLIHTRGECRHIHFAVPVGVSTILCIGGVLEPFYRYL